MVNPIRNVETEVHRQRGLPVYQHIGCHWQPPTMKEINTYDCSFFRPDMIESVINKGASATITRADLAEAVYRKVGLSRAESAELVELVLSAMSDTLASGENVKLSTFGSFLIRSKSQRIGRNPKTGVEAIITPRKVMVFKPSNMMKARVNGQSGEGESD